MRSFLLLFLWTAQVQAMHVIVDPGHGGVDTGTSRRDFKESEISLEVAKRLRSLLVNSSEKFEVTLTREDDRKLTLLERVRIAEQAKGDLLISIHVNSSTDAKARGAEFYFQNQLEADDSAAYLASLENSEPIAIGENPALRNTSGTVKAILEDLLASDRIGRSSELCQALQSHWRGHRKSKSNSLLQAPFVVISQTNMPAVLVELGFVTNTEDFAALTNSDYLNLAAQSLRDGVISFRDHSHTLNHGQNLSQK